MLGGEEEQREGGRWIDPGGRRQSHLGLQDRQTVGGRREESEPSALVGADGAMVVRTREALLRLRQDGGNG